MWGLLRKLTKTILPSKLFNLNWEELSSFLQQHLIPSQNVIMTKKMALQDQSKSKIWAGMIITIMSIIDMFSIRLSSKMVRNRSPECHAEIWVLLNRWYCRPSTLRTLSLHILCAYWRRIHRNKTSSGRFKNGQSVLTNTSITTLRVHYF